MILFLHNRYRTTGGEERSVDELMWLVRERLGEEAELLERDSELVGRRRAAEGMLRGGLAPDDVARAVRRTRARIVHAHNLQPGFGWRALAAARAAGARVVLHLHQYRLVCAVGVCFTEGSDCTRCRGRRTLPGIIHNCRGSRAEALAYGAGLALWQRRLTGHVDAFIAPSRFVLERLHELGAPLDRPVHVVSHSMRRFAAEPPTGPGGYALMAGRLAPEKGIEVAIDACRQADLPLVVAGEGPLRDRLAGRASAQVRFVGHADDPELDRLRAGAAVALMPSLFAESFGLSATEAMAVGLPVAASAIGALPEVVPRPWLARPGDPSDLAAAVARILADPAARTDAIARARAVSSPEIVAPALAAVYDSVVTGRAD